jgi:hypothetical protein
MDHPEIGAATTLKALEREWDLIESVIAFVGSSAASSATVANLQFGYALLAPAQQSASARSVRLVPIWRTDEVGLDIHVERVDR